MMKNANAPFVDLFAFSNKGHEVYAVCNKHIDFYIEEQTHGTTKMEGPWQCDNCPEDYEPATGTVYVVSE